MPTWMLQGMPPQIFQFLRVFFFDPCPLQTNDLLMMQISLFDTMVQTVFVDHLACQHMPTFFCPGNTSNYQVAYVVHYFNF